MHRHTIQLSPEEEELWAQLRSALPTGTSMSDVVCKLIRENAAKIKKDLLYRQGMEDKKAVYMKQLRRKGVDHWKRLQSRMSRNVVWSERDSVAFDGVIVYEDVNTYYAHNATISMKESVYLTNDRAFILVLREPGATGQQGAVHVSTHTSIRSLYRTWSKLSGPYGGAYNNSTQIALSLGMDPENEGLSVSLRELRDFVIG